MCVCWPAGRTGGWACGTSGHGSASARSLRTASQVRRRAAQPSPRPRAVTHAFLTNGRAATTVLCMALHAATGALWTGSAERTIGHFALVDDATTVRACARPLRQRTAHGWDKRMAATQLAPRETRTVKAAGVNAIAVRSDARIVATAGWDGRYGGEGGARTRAGGHVSQR